MLQYHRLYFIDWGVIGPQLGAVGFASPDGVTTTSCDAKESVLFAIYSSSCWKNIPGEILSCLLFMADRSCDQQYDGKPLMV